MRRKLVAGNWKMHGLKGDLPQVSAIADAARANPQVDVALCLPFTLIEAGASVVIVGHSERRGDQHETSHDAWAKAAAGHRHGLHVILCCGETEAERDAGRAERIVQSQIEKSLPEGASGDWLTLAYEPRWAIGTGKTPTLEDIAAIHAIARAKLRQMVGDAADGIRILYGGSVTGANAAAILAAENVDGALVGGASLTAEKFVPIIEAAASLS